MGEGSAGVEQYTSIVTRRSGLHWIRASQSDLVVARSLSLHVADSRLPRCSSRITVKQCRWGLRSLPFDDRPSLGTEIGPVLLGGSG